MSWEAHITRDDYYLDGSHPIPLDEARAALAGSPGFRLRGDGPMRGDRNARLELAVWAPQTAPGTAARHWMISWRDGYLSVWRPDDTVMLALWPVAQALGGWIMNDDGVVYGRDARPQGFVRGGRLIAKHVPLRQRVEEWFYR